MKSLEQLIKQLSPELKKEVLDFALFLIERRSRKRLVKLRQDWAGGIKEFGGRYTSLELQKKALSWRGD